MLELDYVKNIQQMKESDESNDRTAKGERARL